MRTRTLAALLAVVATAAAGCGSATTGATAAAVAWPAPDANRPVLSLAYDMAPDLASATGTESVLFTPDQQVCELVFRNWANKPTTAADGTSTAITAATVDGTAVTPRVEADSTLVTLPLPRCSPAGTPVRIDLSFSLALGRDAGERVGYSPASNIAWMGTAFPLLAWQRSIGWVRDPAVDLFGETVTSEEFRLADLTVTAAAGQQVLGTGAAADTSEPAPGRVAHRFIADAVRDVSVSVGDFDVVTRTVDGVTVHVGTPRSGTRAGGEDWASEIGTQLGNLSALLGPYPYTDLWATIVPPQSDGVEFPTALQFGDERRSGIRSLVAHEVAHQWFYALVGNNQAQNPWLDESFATYAQAIVADQQDQYELSDIPDRLVGDLGRPMSYWARQGGFDRYVRGVYDQGAAVLLEARRKVGPARFDADVRRYLVANAHGVATPESVLTAFADTPELVDLLRTHGAG